MAAADIVVIGAGVVGLACAAAIARRGRSVMVLERNAAPGREVSARNSEVIHAGLYYPPDSWKARTCVAGRQRLYARCKQRGIPHRRTGKLVVATTAEELATLEDIERRARANGAGAIELLDGAQVRREQPRVFAHAALRSPESGIVDAHALTQSYQAELEAHAGQVVTRTCVVGLARSRTGWSLETRGPDSAGSFTVQAEGVINAAGLEADRIAALAGLEIDCLGYRLHPCKGDYFSVVPGLGTLTETLVYPVPERDGLGIHITMDLAGRFRLGPDVEYVARPRYEVDPDKAGAFASAVCRYLPEIRAEHLAPDFAGVRPKLQGPDEPFRDFVIAEESSRGLPGLIDLIGIESPGLTAAGEIAEQVADLV